MRRGSRTSDTKSEAQRLRTTPCKTHRVFSLVCTFNGTLSAIPRREPRRAEKSLCVTRLGEFARALRNNETIGWTDARSSDRSKSTSIQGVFIGWFVDAMELS